MCFCDQPSISRCSNKRREFLFRANYHFRLWLVGNKSQSVDINTAIQQHGKRGIDDRFCCTSRYDELTSNRLYSDWQWIWYDTSGGKPKLHMHVFAFGFSDKVSNGGGEYYDSGDDTNGLLLGGGLNSDVAYCPKRKRNWFRIIHAISRSESAGR